MKKNSLFTRLQTMFGVTKTELTVVIIILSGLLIGTGYNYLIDNDTRYNYGLAKDVYHILDSLAEVQRTSYIGTDLRGNPDKELVPGDTVVAKDSFFPLPKKKELLAERINIKTASKTQLMKIPGVGEKTALSIIEYRQRKPFEKSEDIMKVRGIGLKKFDKIKEYIIVK